MTPREFDRLDRDDYEMLRAYQAWAEQAERDSIQRALAGVHGKP